MQEKFCWEAEILRNVQMATDIFEIEMSCPFDAKKITPGQFVSLAPLAEDSSMSRPFSIAKTFNSSFSIILKVVGKNTDLLNGFKSGQKIKVWGPCGAKLPESFYDYDEFWLVGGGIGIAPLLFFEKVFWLRKKESLIFYGNKTAEDIVNLEPFNGRPAIIATDDGSEGFSGLITEIFLEAIEKENKRNLAVITCGPNIMMRQIARICKRQVLECYVILEKIMACGIGACLGCSIKTSQGMKRVCHDGPVFNSKEVFWNELS